MKKVKTNGPARTFEEALAKGNKFWSTQPVPNLAEKITTDGEITEFNDEIKQKPYQLPEGYEWINFNMENNEDIEKISKFLDKYYKPTNGLFVPSYSNEFFEWYFRNKITNNLCFGVKLKENDLLVSFISGIPNKYQVNRNKLDLVEVNFLCIHPKLRNKRLSPVLIKELTRRSRIEGFKHGIYTTVNYLPKPFYTTKFYHRALNPKILVNSGFIKLEDNISLKMMKQTYRLPDESDFDENDEELGQTKFLKMEDEHLNEAYDVLNNYLGKYNLYEIFTFKDFCHRFHNNNIVTSYVLTDSNGTVVDFVSYCKIPYKPVKKDNKNNKYDKIKSGYLYYYTSNYETPYRLIKNILIIARDEGQSVFSCTNIMENNDILRELNFVEGGSKLNYYLYNWKVRDMLNNQIAKPLF
jgi:glycylpeptide N-tetradecanoyltransferase